MVLEQTIGDMSSCGMEVLQAYLHFEALQSHECPSLLITDLSQKGIFNMAGLHSCIRGDTLTISSCRKSVGLLFFTFWW